METLQLINTLVSAQEILYPCMRKYFNKDFADIINREFLVIQSFVFVQFCYFVDLA
jgi:hypothetical protein